MRFACFIIIIIVDVLHISIYIMMCLHFTLFSLYQECVNARMSMVASFCVDLNLIAFGMCLSLTQCIIPKRLMKFNLNRSLLTNQAHQL